MATWCNSGSRGATLLERNPLTRVLILEHTREANTSQASWKDGWVGRSLPQELDLL